MSTGSAFGIVAGVGLLAALLACSAPSPPPPSPPTIAAAATQMVAVKKGEATLSATAQAVATRVAPTVQAIMETVGPIATSVAVSPVRITDVDINPNNTTVTIHNSGSAAVNLDGWTLLLGPSISIALREIRFDPGQTRTLNLSTGTDTPDNVYLDTSSGGVAITFAPGQRAVLVAPGDQVASVFRP
jgi:hypothetical protein